MKWVALVAVMFFVSLGFVAAEQGLSEDSFAPSEADPIERTEPIPAKYASLIDLTLVAESHEVRMIPADEDRKKAAENLHVFKVRIVNPTGDSIFFVGYDETWPWHLRQRWLDGKWQDHRVGWFCGTGLRVCEIPPRRSAVFKADARESILPVRFGVAFSLYAKPTKQNAKERSTIWSERLEAGALVKGSAGPTGN